MWAGTRRYPCLFIQIMIGVHLLGAAFYLLKRKDTSSYSILQVIQRLQAKDKPVYDPHFADQPSSYTIKPPNLPSYELSVNLPPPTNTTERQAAAFIVLVRNSELIGMLQSMNDVEERFNHKFNYPWIFLNEEPFTEDFVRFTTNAASGKTHYGFVNESMWGYPDWIDQEHAAHQREIMKNLPYGKSESYRHMCRFQSGFFWRHPLVLSLNLEYYWRVEPDVRYFCDLDYDPFLFMKQNKKKYAFNISFKEHSGTIPTLWETVKQFAREATVKGKTYFPNKVTDSIFKFLSQDDAQSYNGCHFWTNFEIARLDLWHTEAYQELFEYLDHEGGFFYERWGDAPVHSIFAALYLTKDEIHFFNDIGYKHSTYQHCPAEESLLRRCACNPASSLDFHDHMSCLTEYMEARSYDSEIDKRTVNDMLLF
ncbi:nucleotide-diphospho-sugar transferase [Gilbertella persicaria]|uniref:nucleotide-diphospho-sugar transferase n=1 Tax=Gilbertella persicaria TaxID=101096 RepID=UPI002220221C|nr:nucleotide-diphospho-sugar transferase [Gilbertella persicaria]KAI8090075.1 nucleotide-diphospho-sugar transferase [Gilbertella persicaria]